MLEPWTTLLLDDARVIHESTPIQPLEGYGHRDTLVLTYRAGSFQGPAHRPEQRRSRPREVTDQPAPSASRTRAACGIGATAP